MIEKSSISVSHAITVHKMDPYEILRRNMQGIGRIPQPPPRPPPRGEANVLNNIEWLRRHINNFGVPARPPPPPPPPAA